jgi:hypothetical protein
MNSHNIKTESIVGNGPVRIGSENEAVKVTGSRRVEATELSVSEDRDQGGDPYNSTGQHVIIKSKIDLQD